MADRLAGDPDSFLERSGFGPVRARLFVTWPRRHLAIVLALVPALAALAIILVDPVGLGRLAVGRDHVSSTFARFLSAIATVGTVAVSVASLTLGREIRGIGGQEEHHDANEGFRDRVRNAGQRDILPMRLSSFLAGLQTVLAEAAARARARASEEALAFKSEGSTLRQVLDALESRARVDAGRFRAAREPHEVLLVALDGEPDVAHHLLRGMLRRGEFDPALREELEGIVALLRDAAIGAGYAKTLDFQWGLSRMSVMVLITTLLALVASAAMVLLYPGLDGSDAGARAVGGAIVSVALFLGLLPVTSFVSFLLRAVTINARTLPTADFVLGPERSHGS